MGLLLSLNKNRGNRSSEEHAIERERKRTLAMEEYEEYKNEGSYWGACCMLCINWEHILNKCQQMLCLYFAILMLAGLGGTLFYISEYDFEQNLLDTRAQKLSELQNTYQNNTEQLAMIMEWGQEAQEFVYPTEEFPNGRNKWEFRYACFFAATTFTTTGFGLQAPSGAMGQFWVIIYGIPSVCLYLLISQSIGTIVLSLFASLVHHCGCISEEYYFEHRLQIVGALSMILFFVVSGIIFVIRTDEGFGNGIYTYFDASYFLFQTTMTIGYGDVMMSGGNGIVTLILGAWLATSIGVFVTLISEIGESFEKLQEATVRKASNIGLVPKHVMDKTMQLNIPKSSSKPQPQIESNCVEIKHEPEPLCDETN